MKNTLLLLFVVVLCGCSQTAPPASDASPAAEPAAVDSGDSPAPEDSADGSTSTSEPLIIDVRSEQEWDDGHLAQAVHIPHTEIADKIAAHTDDKDAKIIVYCAVGGRAGTAKETLEEQGFTNVENGGGYDDMKKRFE
ncbi:rhodanese-like domain-containing protein [Roseimaritima ulvae]|uniref:Thiosulfate sulfurtransferase PspE n=1 Tax=Roseimaritima ulvae TaxID=980254 RepID=A0A5B9QT68_9BACT|nr:rhodanese-like domain-containing protein [Roseimaritima ulvae]QEG41139.1 Thiosulfate sulfurtransferase PspE precursor [Roseimaritima ulvae]